MGKEMEWSLVLYALASKVAFSSSTAEDCCKIWFLEALFCRCSKCSFF